MARLSAGSGCDMGTASLAVASEGVGERRHVEALVHARGGELTASDELEQRGHALVRLLDRPTDGGDDLRGAGQALTEAAKDSDHGRVVAGYVWRAALAARATH